jgi:hypothetical protein
VLWLPLAGALFARVPSLANVPLIGNAPEWILAISIGISLIEGISKLVKMLSRGGSGEPSFS